MKRSAAWVAVALVTAGCATEAHYRESLSRWMGASESQLVSEWGVPERSYQVGDAKFLAFVDKHLQSVGGSSGWCSTGKKGQPYCMPPTAPHLQEFRCETTFQIRNSVVVQWRYEGNNCVAYEPRPDGTRRTSWVDFL
ncbi:MAG: hypothetical protein ACM30I_08115 [Gemmatimonas sp.]